MNARYRPARGFPFRHVFLVALFVAVVAAWAGYRYGLPAYAQDRIRTELEALGFADPQFDLLGVTLRRTRLANLQLDEDLRIASAALDYRLPALIEGRLGALTLEGVSWGVGGDDGAGHAREAAIGAPVGWDEVPFDRLRIVDAQLYLGSSEGSPVATVGRASLELQEGAATWTVHAKVRGQRLWAAGAIDARGRRVLHELSVRAAIETNVAGVRIELRGVRLRGTVAFEGSRLAALHWSGRIEESAVAGHPLGAVRLAGRLVGDRVRYTFRRADVDLPAVTLRGRLPGDPAEWTGIETLPIKWTVKSRRLEESVSGLVPGMELTRAVLSARGTGMVDVASRNGPRVRIEHARVGLQARRARFRAVPTRLTDVRIRLRVKGTVSPHATRLDVDIRDGTGAAAAHMGSPPLTARDMALRGAVRLRQQGAEWNLSRRGPIGVRAATVESAGPGVDMRLRGVTVRVGERGERPLFEWRGGRGRLAARVDAAVRRLQGRVRGRGLRLRTPIDGSFGGGTTEIASPGRVTARVLRYGDDIVVRHARIELRDGGPTNERTAVRLAATRVAWQGIDVCAPSGLLRVTPDGLALRLRCAVGRGAKARLSVRFKYAGGAVLHVVLPTTRIGADEPLGRILEKVSGIRMGVRGGGTASMDLANGTGSAGIHWTRATAGGVELGAGEVDLSVDGGGAIRVDDCTVALAGGRLHIAPFRVDAAASELALDVGLRGLRLDELLRAVSDGRATGRGRLDGRLGFRMEMGERPQIRLGDGYLQARGPGRIRVPAGALNGVVRPDRTTADRLMRRRVVGALADFEYTDLRLVLRDDRDVARLAAHIRGRGTRVPQELDVRVNVSGLHRVSEALSTLSPVDVKLRSHME